MVVMNVVVKEVQVMMVLVMRVVVKVALRSLALKVTCPASDDVLISIVNGVLCCEKRFASFGNPVIVCCLFCVGLWVGVFLFVWVWVW